MAASLRFISGEHKKRVVRIRRGQALRIGRDPECEIRMIAANISRVHARLSCDGADLRIANMSGTNSLTINGSKQDQAVLRQWDVVVIGGNAFRVESIEEESEVILPPQARSQEHPDVDLREQYHTLFECLLGIQQILSQDGVQLIERSLETLFIALPVTRLCLFSIAEDGELVQGFTSTSSRVSSGYMSHTFARKVLAANKAILLETVPAIDPAEWGNTLKEQAIRSILGVPVRMRGTPVAVLLCDNLDQPGILKDAHAQVLEFVSRALEYVFQRDELRKLEAKQLRADHEFLAGQRVQAQIFTKSSTSIIGPMRWAVHYQPALELGGDFYDFSESDGAITWIIADVSGKGIPAALVVSMLKAFCKTLYAQNLGPARFLSALDALCRGELPINMFFTAVVAQIDRSGRLTSCNIGHPAGVILHKDRSITYLKPQNGMLGNAQSGMFTETMTDYSITLGIGDRLVLYTDGLVEASTPEGEQYGDDRLHEALRQSHGSIDQAMLSLVQSVTSFHGDDRLEDDLTVIMGEWAGAAPLPGIIGS